MFRCEKGDSEVLREILLAVNAKGILEMQWSRKKLCCEEETVREFAYRRDRVSAGGGCEVAVNAKKNADGISVGIEVSCCMVDDFVKS